MKEKFFASFAEALEMDVTRIKSEDNFRDYENYSSLTELSVLAMLDSEFGIEIEMSQFNKYKTVGELVELAASRFSK
jgi:acyl carrier protein